MILAKTLENALRKRLVILFDGFARIVSEDASCPAAWINLSFELYFKKDLAPLWRNKFITPI